MEKTFFLLGKRPRFFLDFCLRSGSSPKRSGEAGVLQDNELILISCQSCRKIAEESFAQKSVQESLGPGDGVKRC